MWTHSAILFFVCLFNCWSQSNSLILWPTVMIHNLKNAILKTHRNRCQKERDRDRVIVKQPQGGHITQTWPQARDVADVIEVARASRRWWRGRSRERDGQEGPRQVPKAPPEVCGLRWVPWWSSAPKEWENWCLLSALQEAGIGQDGLNLCNSLRKWIL